MPELYPLKGLEPEAEGPEETSFGQELLAELRRRRFSRQAVRWVLVSAWARARDEVYANPQYVRSVLGWGLAFFAALFAFCTAVSLTLDHKLAVRCLAAGAIWLGLSCAWILAHTGLARDASGARLERMSAPNLLTLFRSALIPPIVLSAAAGHVTLAAAMFAAGGVSDILDGVVARRLGQTTRIGAIMDHMVDIVFFGSTFLVLVAVGLLSPWVGALVVTRYSLVFLGGAFLYVFKGPVKIRPTVFGKFTGAILYFMILAQIGVVEYGSAEAAARLSELLHLGFVFVLTATILQALVIGWYNLRRTAEAHVEVVSGLRMR